MSVVVRVGDPGVAWIEMDEGVNAFTPSLVRGLLEAIDAVARDVDVRAVVLAGTREHFCSGATGQTLRDLRAGRLASTELVLGRRLLDVPVPVIAAAEGSAIGGGLALLLSADLHVIAGESRYGTNFMELGITPGMGSTRLLETVLAPPLAHALLYTATLRRGSTLAGAGFNAVVPRDQVRATAADLAWQIAEKPRANLVLLKRTLSLPKRRALEEAMTFESLMHETSLQRLDESELPP